MIDVFFYFLRSLLVLLYSTSDFILISSVTCFINGIPGVLFPGLPSRAVFLELFDITGHQIIIFFVRNP